MPDKCEFCKGAKGGVLGNENILEGRVLCDYCHAARIFVFGSNLDGRHGMGAALEAKQRFGAQYGRGQGFYGQSFAIPTKGRGQPLPRLSLTDIQRYVDSFVNFANQHPEMVFQLTRVGCGLAGNKDEEIAPMFAGVSNNVIIPKEWTEYVRRARAVVQSNSSKG